MEIKNTNDYPQNTTIMMLVYGLGGVGKTTFASTFPKPLLLDFENGAKYFKERGISIDVSVLKSWLTDEDKKQLSNIIENYDTIVVDPIGEAMEKLINGESVKGSKYRQSNGDLTMAGWGEVKKQMRNFVKWLRDTGKNIVIIAHVDERMDEDSMVKRPLLATKLSEELIALVDIVGYMQVISVEGDSKRVIKVDGSDNKIISKDRTGKLTADGVYIKPEYSYIAGLLGYAKKVAKTTKKTKEDGGENN